MLLKRLKALKLLGISSFLCLSISVFAGCQGDSQQKQDINQNIIRTDMDGDGYEETVEVFSKEYKFTANDGEEIIRRHPWVRVEYDGGTVEESLGSITVYETKMYELDGPSSSQKLIAIAFDVGGTGQGLRALFAISYDQGAVSFMPMPEFFWDFNIEGKGTYGIKAEAKLMNNYEAEITCDETAYTGKLKAASSQDFYDADGVLAEESSPVEIDGICEVLESESNGKRCLELAQYIWGPSHADGIGFLFSRLTWEDDEYKIIDQRVSPFN